MKFACESCSAQYMIADEKVGPNGVMVRCKRCGHRIAVKRPVTEVEPSSEKTVVVPLPGFGAIPADEPQAPARAPQPSPSAPAEPTSDSSDIDDDIGRAFDSMVMGDRPAHPEPQAAGSPRPEEPVPDGAAGSSAAAGPTEAADFEHQPTRVVNLNEVASLLREEPPEAARNLAAGPKLNAAAVEWYVAIDDEQVGPLTLQGVKDRWTRGEVSADSLAWRVGLPDWKAISSLEELVEQLAPLPRPEPERASGATATGAEAPASAVLPPAQSGEPQWKPSAASALEALVKDELAALEKGPNAAAKPLEFKSGSAGPVSTLEMPAVSPAAIAAAQAATPAAAAPPAVAGATAPGASASASAPVPRPSWALPMAPIERQVSQSRTGAWVAIGIGGGLAVAAIVVAVLLMMARQPTVVVATPPSAPVAAAPAEPAPAAEKPAGEPSPAAAAKPAEGAPAEANAEPKPAESPPAGPPAAQAAAAEETAKAEKPAAEARAPVAEERSEVAAREEPGRVAQHSRGGRAHGGREAARESARETRPAEEKASAPVASADNGAKRSNVDREFDQIFGGGGGDSAPAPKTADNGGKGKTVYVPPPVGANSNLPERLGQSDIMAVVLEQKPAIKACVDEQKAKDPNTSGTLVMRWTIRPNGTTTGIQTRSAEFQKTAIAQCIAGHIKNWKFPAYSGAQMPPIDFPFKF